MAEASVAGVVPQSGGRERARHYGKYRATVTDNQDPKSLGRVRMKVPEILGDVDSGWALPCAPYAGDGSGAFAIPAKGALVWAEFEAGDPSRPLWTGACWSGGKLPKDHGGAAATPDVKIVRSEQGLMIALHDDTQEIAVSDANGDNLVHIEVQGGKVTVKAATTVVVDAPQIQIVDGASHPAVFGDQLLSYLAQLVAMFNSHMHVGQVAAPALPVTPAPPVPLLSPPTPDLLSVAVTVG